MLLRNLVSGSKILTQVCLKNDIRLKKLQVVGYPIIGNQDFHRALSHQTSLESLELRADTDPETAFRDDIDVLVSSVSALTNLKYLDLVGTSDFFSTSEILKLTLHLPLLEELSFSGYDVTDALWPGVSRLTNLRSLNIHAITSFSVSAMLGYISTLRDTNRGLHLSIMNQKAENAISGRQEGSIRRAIKEKVDGKFDFTLFREPDSESETPSD